MTDTFRKEYKELSELTKQQIHGIKCNAEILLQTFDLASEGNECDKRCMALAKTKLEESIMWACKAIT